MLPTVPCSMASPYRRRRRRPRRPLAATLAALSASGTGQAIAIRAPIAISRPRPAAFGRACLQMKGVHLDRTRAAGAARCASAKRSCGRGGASCSASPVIIRKIATVRFCRERKLERCFRSNGRVAASASHAGGGTVSATVRIVIGSRTQYVPSSIIVGDQRQRPRSGSSLFRLSLHRAGWLLADARPTAVG